MTQEGNHQSRIAQSKYHALIDDIARQCTFMGRKWRADSWKRLLVAAYVNVERDEAEARGDPDPFPGASMLLIGIDGGSVVQLGEQTRRFTRQQSACFIESVYCYGSERGVIWSEPAKRAIRSLTEA